MTMALAKGPASQFVALGRGRNRCDFNSVLKGVQNEPVPRNLGFPGNGVKTSGYEYTFGKQTLESVSIIRDASAGTFHWVEFFFS